MWGKEKGGTSDFSTWWQRPHFDYHFINFIASFQQIQYVAIYMFYAVVSLHHRFFISTFLMNTEKDI